MTSRPETDMNTSLIALVKMACPSTIPISKLKARKFTFINKLLSPKLTCRMNAMMNFSTWHVRCKIKAGVLLEPSGHVEEQHHSTCSGLGTSERSTTKLFWPYSDKVKKFSVPCFSTGWGLIPNCTPKLQALWFAYQSECSSLKLLSLNPVDSHILQKAELRTDFSILQYWIIIAVSISSHRSK